MSIVNKPTARKLNSTEYKLRLENTSLFNSRLQADRNTRLPFFDTHTGVAQTHSNLYIAYRYRRPGNYFGQLYSYPERIWKKRKRSEAKPAVPEVEEISSPAETEAEAEVVDVNPPEIKPASGQVENMKLKPEPNQPREDSNQWETWDSDSNEPAKKDSSDDYESSYVKRKSKKKGKPVSARTPRSKTSRHSSTTAKKEDRHDVSIDYDQEKPFGCETCGARYKTRPGINYHLSHTHNCPELPINEDPVSTPACTVTSTTVTSKADNKDNSSDGKSDGTKVKPSPNNYCDFCLGLNTENKKTGKSEQLFSCADCGHSGHPSCLQFSDNMLISVKKYAWQCIECKSCGLCGTSDNDEELLFCDDCDRGYHMYCLQPAISSPPDGSWSCHLCVKEFDKNNDVSDAAANKS